LSKSPVNDVEPVATIWLLDGRVVSDQQLLPYLTWLGQDEAERYQRFTRPQRQRQFLLGRILLRSLLAQILNVAPADVLLSERLGLAPLLQGVGAKPYFSLSHSGEWIACALSEQMAVGLDIEVLNPERDLLALSEQALDPDEVALVRGLQGEARVKMFYQCWSRKEALYKLASTDSSASGQHCINLSHPDISIVLCSPSTLMSLPMLQSFQWPVV
jgi:4'-phosphopantetheinyl transferase